MCDFFSCALGRTVANLALAVVLRQNHSVFCFPFAHVCRPGAHILLPRLGTPLQTNYAGKCTGEASAGEGGPRGNHQRGGGHSLDLTKYNANTVGEYNILTNGSRGCVIYISTSR